MCKNTSVYVSFTFAGTVNALSVKESRYFKPSPNAFHTVKGRSSAWKIKPGSYFLLPFKQAFGQEFPKDSFTVFLTFKPSKDSEVRSICKSNVQCQLCYYAYSMSKNLVHIDNFSSSLGSNFQFKCS